MLQREVGDPVARSVAAAEGCNGDSCDKKVSDRSRQEKM
jgi:hypothetical protein